MPFSNSFMVNYYLTKIFHFCFWTLPVLVQMNTMNIYRILFYFYSIASENDIIRIYSIWMSNINSSWLFPPKLNSVKTQHLKGWSSPLHLMPFSNSFMVNYYLQKYFLSAFKLCLSFQKWIPWTFLGCCSTFVPFACENNVIRIYFIRM